MRSALKTKIMTPMSNFMVGCYMLTINSIVHGATLIHLGKFVREEYISNMLKYKVNIIDKIFSHLTAWILCYIGKAINYAKLYF